MYIYTDRVMDVMNMDIDINMDTYICSIPKTLLVSKDSSAEMNDERTSGFGMQWPPLSMPHLHGLMPSGGRDQRPEIA